MKIHAICGITAVGIGISGCAATNITPAMIQSAEHSYPVAVVGDVGVNDTLWQNYGVEVQRALASKLMESMSFAQVSAGDASPPVMNVVLITGKVTEVDKGNVAARWIIGFGAGAAHLSAEFQIARPDGSVIGKFTVRKTYAGGAGLGGANLLDMDDLATQAGEESAKVIATWTKTGKL